MFLFIVPNITFEAPEKKKKRKQKEKKRGRNKKEKKKGRKRVLVAALLSLYALFAAVG